MKKLLLAVLIFSSSIVSYSQRCNYVDHRLAPYLSEFMHDMVAAGIDTSKLCTIDSIILMPGIYFYIDADRLVGYSYGNGNVAIATADVWFGDDDQYYRTVLWHELGHALFDFDHDDNGYQIMNTEQNVQVYYRNLWGGIRSKYIKCIQPYYGKNQTTRWIPELAHK
jgi:hypothetical protein